MSQDISEIKKIIDVSEEILVLLAANPGPDSIASALSLTLALESAQKHVTLACATPIDFSEYPLRQTHKITQKIGNKNLVVSLKLDNRDSVDKVSYNLDETAKVFNLVISPKKGAAPLLADNVSYSLSGARADLIITVGAMSFEDLGSLYTAEPNLFTENPTLAINRVQVTPFAKHHLMNPPCSSVAEFMTEIITSLELTITPDIATNLMAAIDVITEKLTLGMVTPATFDAVAKLMRAGAARIMLNPAVNNPQPAPNNLPLTPVEALPETPAPINDQPATISEMPSPEDVPTDWLEPKILKATAR